MTADMVAEVIAEYDWQVPYTIEDVSPDGVAVVFPRCRFQLVENGFDGTVAVQFPPEVTGWEHTLTLVDALIAISPDAKNGRMAQTPGLIRDLSLPSPERVRNELRDAFRMVRTHLSSCVLGDFGWVERLRQHQLGRGGVS